MSKIQSLLDSYASYVSFPWQGGLSSQERVWFCRYDPPDERRLRARLGAFELATREANRKWLPLDITYSFETWLANHEYREQFFYNPKGANPALDLFQQDLTSGLQQDLAAGDETTVAALIGAGALFGLIRVSRLIELIAPSVRGRLLVFFPGTRRGSVYRLLDARDGWNYLAVPIEAEERTE
ncbi:MAG: BREX protein BrxB domain-containing protein [bacterium]|jgi:hypothetical protein|nr:DUF1788 domain-containing protein [Bacillota bacterium]